MGANPGKAKQIAYQAAAIAAALGLGWFLISNTLANLEARRIASGFGFLGREAGFEIGESFFLRYGAADSYLRALAVGLANTLTVAAIGIVLATGLGTVVGLCRLSRNLLLRSLSAAYVEFIRNVPLLVQLFFWYALITEALPAAREALQPLPGVFLSNRGIYFPSFSGVPVLRGLQLRRRRRRSSPEFAALLIGLVTYTAGFIAEIVRAGVLSVVRGQREAAQAIGLTRPQALRHVVLPQALRVIVPPMTSQYLNLTKNSSLAVAIGYPGPGVDRQHHHQPDRPGDRGHRHHHGGVPDDQPVDLGVHELVQRAGAADEEAVFSRWQSLSLTLAIALAADEAACCRSSTGRSSRRSGAPDPKACRAAAGACWGFIAEKHRFILFGTYPFEEHWRPALATAAPCCPMGSFGFRMLLETDG